MSVARRYDVPVLLLEQPLHQLLSVCMQILCALCVAPAIILLSVDSNHVRQDASVPISIMKHDSDLYVHLFCMGCGKVFKCLLPLCVTEDTFTFRIRIHFLHSCHQAVWLYLQPTHRCIAYLEELLLLCTQTQQTHTHIF